MPRVDVVNLIPYHAGKAQGPEALKGLSPRAAAERVRESCTEKGASYSDWAGGILQHCLIPADHPYRLLMAKRRIKGSDPLYVLGAIAYGTQSPWIVFGRIEWDDGKVDLPDELEREWLKRGTL